MAESTLRLIEAAAVVIATMLGPILAVQIQKLLERKRALSDRQVEVFRTLMTGRLVLTYENVRAFNAVPVEFYGQTAILEAWRAYVAYMAHVPPADSPDLPAWNLRRIDLLLDLLQKMAAHVGYPYTFVQLRNDWYRPRVHDDVEADQQKIRNGVAALLEGKIHLPLDVKRLPADEELNALLKEWLRRQIRD
jgi:hypothetical protein